MEEKEFRVKRMARKRAKKPESIGQVLSGYREWDSWLIRLEIQTRAILLRALSDKVRGLLS